MFYLKGKNNPFAGPVSFVDETTFIIDDGDATKRFKFQADGIDPGVTRTYRVPNQDTDLVGTNVIQILTNKTMVGPTNQVGATQFETSNPFMPVIINNSAPTGAGQVLVTTNTSNAVWTDVSTIVSNETITYTLMPNKVSAASTNLTAVANFPWSTARYGTYTNGVLILHTTVTNRDLDVQLYDVTNAVVLANQTGINTTGVLELPLTSLPINNANIILQISKDSGGGTSPTIEGCSLEFNKV